MSSRVLGEEGSAREGGGVPVVERWGKLVLAATILLASQVLGWGGDSRVLGTDRDLDGLAAFPARSVVSWRWSVEEKQQADQFSRMELTRDSAGAMLWTLRIAPAIPFKRPYLEILSLGNAYFPPEADALRMKVRAVSGRMILGFGGPTAYFGNSDVFLRPICVEAAGDGSEWRTVEFSLHHGLFRNFRRAGFSENAPWIYYARWTQEPTWLYVFKGSGGEVHLKDLEIVAHGLARPFPVFGAEEVIPVATLADFAAPTAEERIFTALITGNDQEFDASWSQKQPVVHPPPDLRFVTDREEGRILRGTGRFLEEMSAVGVRLSSSGEGDGLRFRIKVDTEASSVMVPAVQCQPLDFLLYESLDPAVFDWRPFMPSAGLRAGPGKGYDLNLAYGRLKSVAGLSMAIYHARRFLPKGRWSDTTLPFADFLCIYGCGSLSDRFHGQLSPDPRKLVAAVVLAPWPRKGRAETALDLREISLVKFKGEPESRRSYFQFPDAAHLKSVRSAKGGFSFLLAPGESDLPRETRAVLDALD
ncbi:MAG: hypothetical protein ACOYMV_06845 [Verrucomicrobiia bacterium]